MKVGTWNECCTSSNHWEDENLEVKDLIESLVPAEPEDCTTSLLEFDNLEALTTDQSTDELVAMHHVSKIGKSLKKSKKAEKVVALSRMGSTAHATRFKSTEALFSKVLFVTTDAPSTNDLETLEFPADFKN